MKRVLVIVTLCVLVFGLCACGTSAEPEESLSDRAVTSTEQRIRTYINLAYEIRGVPQVNSYVKEIGDGVYEVTGKVTIRDEYGDSYTGKFDATATYDATEDEFDIDYDVGNLYKD